ncbi:MAG: hypothetical protein SGBAC_004654 [Bacillariaceae sp.]
MPTAISSPMVSAGTFHNEAKRLDTNTRSRRVHFAEKVKEVFHVLSRRDYLKSELKQCFYTPDDRCRIELERQYGVRRLEKEQKKKLRMSSSLRGLETQTREGGRLSEKRVWAVVDSVLDEQDNQLECDAFDDDRIAAASQENSIESTLIALRAAIVDHQAAFSVYRNWALENPSIFAATTA